ncbi:CRISPR-associated Csd1 family protein [Halopolyspora algeriensis]|uniref:CRISPR-associated Csd1 family protein n=1 Tax=Halopolyspora algeriensis TaxID=1500506 RepID=A0A368VTP9_9ACTN|nr:type I-C CRISPR-associated protein Cas8c/Csd1 [Halopolyspora algeriensis]RCW45125.1 CRISPR-associated Csd1 family protein [Halopolyspora algeriensis]TQM53153.1 CRISPR-associated Csd1 family protein [Halopolyspora algeriensis]
MLLQRLVDYAHQHTTSAPFHRQREFIWRLNLPSDGGPARLFSVLQADGRGKLRGEFQVAPSVTRTVGVAPNLGADDVQYVLGWGDETTKPDRVRQCHEQFVELVSRWASSVDGMDPAAAVVSDFYANGGVESLPAPEEAYTAKQGVLITVDDIPVIHHDSLVRFWVEEVIRRKGGSEHELCLVCGRYGALADTIPGKVAKRLVPGAGNDPALVSVNELVFGYGLTKGLRHTPICFTCGNAVNTGLTQLLSSEHVMTFAQQDSAMAWWTLGEPDEDFLSVLSTRPETDAVNRLLERLRSGRLEEAAQQAEEFSADRFCSVSLGGNASRIMIRDWIDKPLATVVFNLARWYEDMLMVSRQQSGELPSGFWNLVLAIGKWDTERNLYADLSSTAAQRPAHIQRDLLTSSLRGSPLPPSVLHHVLRRITSDGHLDLARAALLRLALRRHPTKEFSMPAGLDETCQDTAYVSGRIFAHLEQIQYAASDGRPNTTFGDRFLAGAISNPTPALNAGKKLASSWLAKLRRRQATAGKAVALDRKLSELHALLDRNRPATGYLPAEQQALFLLGYHHQKAHDAEQVRQYKSTTGDSASE